MLKSTKLKTLCWQVQLQYLYHAADKKKSRWEVMLMMPGS